LLSYEKHCLESMAHDLILLFSLLFLILLDGSCISFYAP